MSEGIVDLVLSVILMASYALDFAFIKPDYQTCIYLFIYFMVPGIEPMASRMLSKHSTTVLHLHLLGFINLCSHLY